MGWEENVLSRSENLPDGFRTANHCTPCFLLDLRDLQADDSIPIYIKINHPLRNECTVNKVISRFINFSRLLQAIGNELDCKENTLKETGAARKGR